MHPQVTSCFFPPDFQQKFNNPIPNGWLIAASSTFIGRWEIIYTRQDFS